MQENKSSQVALAFLISLFFFWGAVAASIDILIPFFKQRLHLEQWQAQMIAFCFFGAYTVGSVIYYFISRIIGEDLLNRIGYRNGIAIGLLIAALGTLLFYPAVETVSFTLMISGYFILGLGFSLLQTAANPLTIVLGDPKNGSQRLSLAGGINNIGSLLGPLIVSFAIFGSGNSENSNATLDGLKMPFIILGIVFLAMAVLFKLSPIPDRINLQTSDNASDTAGKDRMSVFNYPQLWLGMIGIFVYVGVEVATGSNLSEYLKQHLSIDTRDSAPFISLYWGSLLIGRWTAAVSILTKSKSTKTILGFVMPFIAFAFILLVKYIAGNDLTKFLPYAFVLIALIVVNFLSKGNPVKQLFIFSIMGTICLFTGMLTTGLPSAYAFMSVGLFCSTLWPCIFTLAIAGLGKHTSEGSGFLIMMIMGGGFISVFQGYVSSDNLLGIKYSYLVGVFCFAYLAWYALKAKSILIKQGIDYDKVAEVAH